jgi:general stress protein 26
MGNIMKQDIKRKILKLFAAQPILASFATIAENKKPWVRYVTIVMDPKTFKIRFATHVSTRKVKHISKQPEVHLTCGINDPKQFPGSYLQIQGKAKISTTAAERKKVWNKELKKFFKGVNDPNYSVIIVEPYHIELDMFDANGCHNLVWDR